MLGGNSSINALNSCLLEISFANPRLIIDGGWKLELLVIAGFTCTSMEDGEIAKP